jgi:hypothetical protein
VHWFRHPRPSPVTRARARVIKPKFGQNSALLRSRIRKDRGQLFWVAFPGTPRLLIPKRTAHRLESIVGPNDSIPLPFQLKYENLNACICAVGCCGYWTEICQLRPLPRLSPPPAICMERFEHLNLCMHGALRARTSLPGCMPAARRCAVYCCRHEHLRTRRQDVSRLVDVCRQAIVFR